jgi:hypothetical protein
VILDYIEANKQEYGVAPICRVLTEHGCPIAPSTYYEARGRAPSRRQVRDDELSVEIGRVHSENYSVYGARKVWLQLRRDNIDVARCTVERLMRQAGLEGARRGKVNRTTVADPQGQRAQDLVGRKFNPQAPNVLWVADFKCRRRHFRSVTHLRLGTAAVKSRSSRSGARRESLPPGMVVRCLRPLITPESPSSPISRSTVHAAT